jgi:hypothetical protein
MRTHNAGDTSCAGDYQEVRLVDKFAQHAHRLGLPSGGRGTVMVGAMTVADMMARWWNQYGTYGVGLAGGTFTTAGLRHVSWDMDKLRYVDDVAVSGHVEWNRYNGAIVADIRCGAPV